MDVKRLSRQTCRFLQPPGVVSFAAVAGKLEGEGPLGGCFDAVGTDAFCGKKTWEQGEAQMQADALRLALQKGGLAAADAAALRWCSAAICCRRCAGAGGGGCCSPPPGRC